MTSFDDLAIATPFSQKLAERGITQPTEIQTTAIPPLLEGRDLIIHSQTGTGKTLAYLLPVLSRVKPDEQSLQAIVLVPTRELGMQIINEARSLTEGTPIVAQQLIGGANIRHQVDRLKKRPHIVVGTPGRIAELIRMGKLKAHGVTMLVLDEVDQVLDPSFQTDLTQILKATSRERQTIFASATITEKVLDVARRWMRDPLHVHVKGPLTLPETLSHVYVVAEERDRVDTLRRLLHAYQPTGAIAFVNEGRRLEELVSKLSYKGLTVAALHGEARKMDRGAVMKALREGQLHVLLATEVAARGLDIQGLSHVFNLDLPTDAEHYLHRAGRTGRQGQAGTVVSVVTPTERFVVEKFAKALGIEISPITLSHGSVRPAR